MEQGEAQGDRFFRPGLTGLRALAACWVMLFHLNAIVGPRQLYLDLGFTRFEVTHLFTIGWVGVDLFFVLSGFLLTTHLLEVAARKSWPEIVPRYLGARLRRVLPAYYVQVAILFVVALAATGAAPPWSAYIPLHAVMLHTMVRSPDAIINAVYWTLPIEFSFYLALPLIARRLAALERESRARRWLTLLGMLLAALVVTWAYRFAAFKAYEGSGDLVWATSQLPGTLDQFMLGVVTATGLRWGSMEHRAADVRARSRVSAALLALGLAGVVSMMYFLHRIHDQYWASHWALFVWHTMTAAFIAMMVLGIALSGRLARLLFENRAMIFVGTISYSVYLWHLPIAFWIAHAIDMKGMGLATFLAIAAPVILLASALSYYLVERPFLRAAAAAPRAAENAARG
jgi:peptidoglycan/LPS O-acetylase OafA/YrhL